MSETEKNIKDALAKLGELSRLGIGKAKESIIHSSHIVRAKIDLSTLERERKRLLAELGEEVFSAVTEGKIETSLFDDQIGNIRGLDVKIAAKQKELRQAGEEPTTEAEEGSETAEEAPPAAKTKRKASRKKKEETTE